MDVAIATLHDNTNFGNRLQNFALQEAVFALGGTSVRSLRGLPRGESRELAVKRRLSAVASDPGAFLRRALARSWNAPPDRRPNVPERNAAIRSFTDSQISTVDFPPPGSAALKELVDRTERFVVGSDQVWNPAFTHGNEEWFLNFAQPRQRIAYAASFGIPRVPRYLVGRYRRDLAGIPHLSVREDQAVGIVRELTGRTVPVVLDPTMLHERGFWEARAVTPTPLEGEDYLLTFRLKAGDSASTPTSHQDPALDYARASGLRVVDLFAPDDPALLSISPLGFIGTIRNAHLVVTDSFHGAVFSLLFHTPFLLEQRGAMNSRIETLLSASGLHNRMLHEVQSIGTALEIDWADVDDRLARRRRDSLAFLEGALADGAQT